VEKYGFVTSENEITTIQAVDYPEKGSGPFS
jgi:hypothetical protein